MTLRRLLTLLSGLPPDSSLHTAVRGGRPHWTLESHLLDELRMTWTGSAESPAQPHPDRPVKATGTDQTTRIERARRREAARQRKLAARRAARTTSD